MALSKRNQDESSGSLFRARRDRNRKPPPSQDARFDAMIASHYSSIPEVEQWVMEQTTARNFSANSIFAIKIAVEEGLINAIKHGNKLDPEKKVHVIARISTSKFEMDIEDQGLGFDRQQVPDPTIDANLLNNCGRGITLIEAYMTEISYAQGGRRLHLLKKNDECGPHAR